MKQLNEPCEFLSWDTEFFEHRIGRIHSNQLDDKSVESIFAWSENNGIECLYFLANSDDPDTIRSAEQHHFQLVEIRLNMERFLGDWQPETRPRTSQKLLIRPGKPDDIPAVQEIAKDSYLDSRFYFDKCFSEGKWQAYYATWVKKSFSGGAELVLVAEIEHEIVGYITGKIGESPTEGIYELTGVKPEARRAGVGQELFRSGLDWYKQNGVEYVWLATQGRNVATQRMIQRNGFITKSCQLYYHKWFRECPA
jgi:ribosomal protein S18 acetylase RimI-like enzyme